jgi:hypothetical protein
MSIPHEVDVEDWRCLQGYLYGQGIRLIEAGGTVIEVPYNCERYLEQGTKQQQVTYLVPFSVDTSTYRERAEKSLSTLLGLDGLLGR